jgi:hypothetical protein
MVLDTPFYITADSHTADQWVPAAGRLLINLPYKLKLADNDYYWTINILKYHIYNSTRFNTGQHNLCIYLDIVESSLISNGGRHILDYIPLMSANNNQQDLYNNNNATVCRINDRDLQRINLIFLYSNNEKVIFGPESEVRIVLELNKLSRDK